LSTRGARLESRERIFTGRAALLLTVCAALLTGCDELIGYCDFQVPPVFFLKLPCETAASRIASAETLFCNASSTWVNQWGVGVRVTQPGMCQVRLTFVDGTTHASDHMVSESEARCGPYVTATNEDALLDLPILTGACRDAGAGEPVGDAGEAAGGPP
jgi:hypothetical protein